MSLGPDQVLNPGDPGDDTQRRFRYQAVRACCYILAIFDEEEGIEEVFCEHHEDILLKYRSGTFLGVQIKTKLDGSVPVKAGDEEVIRSLKRFIETEKEFPGYFDGYLLASNSGFWRDVKNGSNLQHVLDETSGKDLKSAGKLVQTLLAKLCPEPKPLKAKAAPKKAKGAGKANKQAETISTDTPTSAGPSETHDVQLQRGLEVLKKLRLELTPPMANMELPLLEALAKCPLVGQHHLYSDLKTIADTLIAEVLLASSKEHASCKTHYFAICRNPGQAQTESLIAAKRFARSRADEVIRRGFGRVPRPSVTTPFSVDQLPQGTRIQQAKMTAGGIVIDDVDEAVQQRQAAEYIVSTWINKYGVPKANAKYQDVRSAVLTECNEAKNQAAQAGGQYGPDTLGLVKERVRALHAHEGPRLHDLRYDQLLGIAGFLTEECRLWWSEKFDLSEGVGS
jgi:hypothetical protein